MNLGTSGPLTHVLAGQRPLPSDVVVLFSTGFVPAGPMRICDLTCGNTCPVVTPLDRSGSSSDGPETDHECDAPSRPAVSALARYWETMPDPELERVAAKTLEELLGGHAEYCDVPGAPDGTHDFDLHVADRVLSVEVTTAADQEEVAFDAAIAHQNRPLQHARQSWVVHLSKGVHLRNAFSRIDRHLARLEEDGVDCFDGRYPHDPEMGENGDHPTVLELADLGVLTGAACGPGNTLFISRRSLGAASPDHVNRVVEACAARTDNLKKLRGANGHKRHLFVWVDGSSTQAFLMMTEEHLPETGPRLPDPITTAWAATGNRRREDRLVVTHLWQASGVGWTSRTEELRDMDDGQPQAHPQ